MSRDWDAHFMAKAHLNAQMGTCRTRKVGAVAVIDRRQVVDAFNGNAPGAVHCVDGGCARCADESIASGSQLSRCSCIHSEQSLVGFAARRGIALDGATVYLTLYPCIDCLKLLASAGIIDIVYDSVYDEENAVSIDSRVTLRKLNLDQTL